MSDTERGGAMLEITYVKSAIGYRSDQAHTIRSLGLRKLGQTTLKPDTADVRGMVRKVAHLVTVTERSSGSGGPAVDGAE